jgi:hypothetical protein
LQLPIEEYFSYHPPTTQARVLKHDRINAAALELARVIQDSVADEDCGKMALFAIQQARMFANQGVTVDELKGDSVENLNPKTLEQYFLNHAGVAMDFRLRIDYAIDGTMSFSVCPAHTAGQSWKFNVTGNLLKPVDQRLAFD